MIQEILVLAERLSMIISFKTLNQTDANHSHKADAEVTEIISREKSIVKMHV
jgi:hypothetical protein